MSFAVEIIRYLAKYAIGMEWSMDELLAVFKALSDRNRLRIISALRAHESLCACQLTELIQVTGATLSRHMGILVSSGLVTSMKEGRWVHYSMCQGEELNAALLEWMEERLSGDPQVSSDLETLIGITSVDREEICRKQRSSECHS